MRLTHGLAVALLAVTPVVATGCSVLSEACQKALPVLSQANSLANDASIALEAASDAIEKSSLSEENKAKVRTHVETARLALQAASTALVSASNACSAPDARTVFRDFLTAWAAIRPFLALIGTNAGGSTVQDPMVYRMTVAN